MCHKLIISSAWDNMQTGEEKANDGWSDQLFQQYTRSTKILRHTFLFHQFETKQTSMDIFKTIHLTFWPVGIYHHKILIW